MKVSIIVVLSFVHNFVHAQDFRDIYERFQQQSKQEYSSFRDECNKKYAQFLREAWNWYEGNAPLPLPKERTPIPPRPYKEDNQKPTVTEPVNVNPIDDVPQPKPIEPIYEKPSPQGDYFSVDFFGAPCRVRLPQMARLKVNDCSPNAIADAWEALCTDEMDNAIRDCLETRVVYDLCDWAYLLFLHELCERFCQNANGATLLMAFLYCQSGYQMRLAVDGGKLVMLYGSRHIIYDKGYYTIDGTNFYPLEEPSNTIQICNGAFENEKPMSLFINAEQKLGTSLSDKRTIKSGRYTDVVATSQVPKSLIDFYNTYPTSELDENPLTRWAMYANVPLAKVTQDVLYPALKKAIDGCSEDVAANKLLNWVQTGFVYEYDDKVWGCDRAFFAEETLYYPYCDCEDRSILFSRLVRDLLHLDVALVYYPGHLATAVCFNNDIDGDAMIINGRKFIVCDPTYIGAPIGAQMPNLDHSKAQAIMLK